MPAGPLYFGNDQRSGDHQLAGASPLAINVVADAMGAVRRRPGIAVWSGFPEVKPSTSAVIGLYDFEDELYVVYADRRIFKIAAGVATDLSTGGGPSYLAGLGRPVFAETAFRLVIAGGLAPEKVDSGEVVAERLGGSPPPSSHIIAVSSRLVSNDITDASTEDRFRWSDTGSAGNEVWDALNVQTAEARPDGIVAVHAGTNQIYVFGARTLQVFSAAVEVTPPAAGSFPTLFTLQRGCIAAFSVIRSDEDFAWLTDKRTFVLATGQGGITPLSDPIARTLDLMTTVDDAIGFRWNADQFDCLCWLFPTDGRAFVIQQGGGWAQWHAWTEGQGHTALPITAHHYWPEENVHLVGLDDGTIAQLDPDAPDDLGETIKAEVLTGFINRDTDAVKHCQAARFTFRRGHGTSPDPQVLLSWRDDLGAFCAPIRMTLGVTGNYTFTIEKRSLGTYRSRQWKLEFTEAVDFVLARAEEIFTLGGSN